MPYNVKSSQLSFSYDISNIGFIVFFSVYILFSLFSSTETGKCSIDFIFVIIARVFFLLTPTFSILRYYGRISLFFTIASKIDNRKYFRKDKNHRMKSMDDSYFSKNLHKSCIIETPKINQEDEVTHWEGCLKNFEN